MKLKLHTSLYLYFTYLRLCIMVILTHTPHKKNTNSVIMVFQLRRKLLKTVGIQIKRKRKTVLREHTDFCFEIKIIKIFSTSIVNNKISPFCPELLQMSELKKATEESLVTPGTLCTLTMEQPMTKISISMSLTYDWGER